MALTFTGVSETTVQSITVDGSAVTDADDDLTFAAANVTVATTTFVVTGGAGDDILGGGSGADTLNGGSGADSITGGAGADIIDGGAGNDIISTTGALLTGLDTVVGGAGTDVLSLADASTVIDDDFANVTTLETVTNATAAALTITLGTAAAAAGVVTLNGNSAVDTITLGSGFTNNITITGNAGADIYVFSAYTGTATVTTGNGAHGITLGTGTEKITGGTGVETVQVAATAHLASTDVLTGGNATDVINFSAAATVTDAQFTNVTTFETITSGNVILNLTGGAQLEEAGISTITLGNASNIINLSSVSSSTNMTVTGGTGADSIRGGAGNDILSGGNGADTYVFNATGALNGTDVVTFVVGGDKFDFSNMGTFTFLATKVAFNAATDIVITNKIVMLADADLAASTNTITEIAADIQGAATAMELQSGGKAIVIAGYDGDALDGAIIYLVDDSLGDTTGTIEADDIVKIATLATFDVDTFTGYNFV
jgi:Ca2+-binding RTX toxin-like protein